MKFFLRSKSTKRLKNGIIFLHGDSKKVTYVDPGLCLNNILFTLTEKILLDKTLFQHKKIK